MAGRRRILWWAAGIVALILVSGFAASRLLLDEERLKSLANEKAHAMLGRELRMEELSLRLFPVPSLQARNIVLSNPPWAKDADFIRAESVAARLELLPLLKRQVVVSALSIDGLSVDLEASAKNGKNWDFGKAHTQKSGSPSIVQFDRLDLRSVDIRNARIRYADEAGSPKEWMVENLAANGEAGWRNVAVEASILRNAYSMKAKGRFDDLSSLSPGLGRDGAVTEGELELKWGPSRLALNGLFPLDASLRNQRLKAGFESSSLRDLLGFYGVPDAGKAKVAAIKAGMDLVESDGSIRIDNLTLQIGNLQAAGQAVVERIKGRFSYRANLAAERMNWGQTMLDLGRPPLPPPAPGQLFRAEPFAWGLIGFLQRADGRIDLRVKRLISRSGIELKEMKAQIDINEKRLNAEPFSFAALNGHVKGRLRLDAGARAASLRLETENIMLGQWLAARGSRLSMTGGPMRIRADVSASGGSMKDLVSSLAGQVDITVGPSKLHSKKMQQAESWLTGLLPFFSTSEADHVNLACIGAYLPFRAGRAQAEPIVGIRSDASQLLTSGYIDFRTEEMDLRGKIKARSGVSLGVSNIAGGDVKIAGRMSKLDIGLDPAGTPGALARIGAAILTSGVSLLATAIWDAANPASDPCQIALSSHRQQSGKASGK